MNLFRIFGWCTGRTSRDLETEALLFFIEEELIRMSDNLDALKAVVASLGAAVDAAVIKIGDLGSAGETDAALPAVAADIQAAADKLSAAMSPPAAPSA